MSVTAQSHGLDGDLVQADWRPLAVDEVRALFRQFPGLDGSVDILLISPRPLSAASVVAVGGSLAFVKRHHRKVRDREGLLEEHRFIAHLRGHGLPVPAVLATGEGETAIEDSDWTYEVHETPEGVDAYREAHSWTPFWSSAHARSAGRMLARLHAAAQGFTAPQRRPRPLVAGFSIFAGGDAAAAMTRYLADRPTLARDASTHRDYIHALEVLAPFHAELSPHLSSLEPMWTHNDLHASNLFWSDTGPDARATSVIDFGLCDRTNAVHDLAHAIERNMVEWLALPDDPRQGDTVPLHLDHMLAFLDGYEELRPLTLEEAAALAPMTALCHAEFALTEADYFLGVLRSPEKARLATDKYLVGHGQWWRSAPGQRLLDTLRQRAELRCSSRQKETR